jgi:hypothetical protein
MFLSLGSWLIKGERYFPFISVKRISRCFELCSLLMWPFLKDRNLPFTRHMSSGLNVILPSHPLSLSGYTGHVLVTPYFVQHIAVMVLIIAFLLPGINIISKVLSITFLIHRMKSEVHYLFFLTTTPLFTV